MIPMKKKAKKNLVALVSLLAVFALLLGGYFAAVELTKEEEETPEADTSVTVFDKGKTIITALSFKSEKEEMAFDYVGDDWKYRADQNFPLDQDKVAAMAQAVGKITATVTIGEAEELSAYGLDKPAVKVDATFSDGAVRSFLFGDTNSFNSCQYFTMTGDSKVYMVESDVATAFAADLDYLYDPEVFQLQKDMVSDDDISHITVKTKGNAKTISDMAGISSLYELVYELDLSTYEDYYADSTEMKDTYGIYPEGESVTVSYTVESDIDGKTTKVPKEYTIYIGHKFESAEEGEKASSDETTSAEDKSTHSYFYTYAGSTVVYSIEGETVDEIFEYLAYTTPAGDTTAAQ